MLQEIYFTRYVSLLFHLYDLYNYCKTVSDDTPDP